MPEASISFNLNSRLCKACGICVALCPKDALFAGDDGKPLFDKPEVCVGCKSCEIHCPDFAIRIGGKDNG